MAHPCISILREEMPGEKRVVLRPEDLAHFRSHGYEIIVVRDAGLGVGFSDNDYIAAGARIVTAEEAWAASDFVAKVKAPTPKEFRFFRRGLHLSAVFHAEGDRQLTEALVRSGTTAYSYEFFRDPDGEYPLAIVGAEIAGKLAVLYAAYHLQASQKGRGILLPHVPGARRARVLIIGHGKAGAAAAHLSATMGAEVRVIGRSTTHLRRFRATAPTGVTCALNSSELINEWVPWADVVIGAILVSTDQTPPMVPDALVEQMRAGSVIIDVTCGYGSGYLPSFARHTDLTNPTYERHGVLHCKIDNLPAAVPVTTVEAFCSVAAPYLLELGDYVCGRRPLSPTAKEGLIISDGAIVHPVVRDHMALQVPSSVP